MNIDISEPKYLFIPKLLDILQIAINTKIDMDLAFDLYLIDMKNEEGTFKNSGLIGYDFVSIHADWNSLNEEEQEESIELFKQFVDENLSEICSAYFDDDIETIENLALEFIG